ncbi:LPXTG cell wall anchor domain-containing protein [Limosilactobacillus reuteri]|uniref:LPXTG cell wall anchor domain-containing protein n=1 Tax=Limosilactobacillus reuteri TaxID=1598 RepID=UPI001E468C76|nr:LPXTG cell wall anchor domain-containing protein [Limosilactobacillus reuteri]MCC4343151.1 LPXTG cell wall anchor domain-containing protein [Limosilactobacillus reuteri]MCC4355496.1 LPXTG cell wall anchor domain-containing protein [Limosilactobacillus reuteri]WJK29997.1 LPXTG cell wall anchor domain-containing protein [Limosilactobacillus reuteri]
MMTREEYKAQQAKLPQTSDSKNDKAVAVAGLGILAATTFTTMIGVAKKRHN